jgi:fibronectin-binding autotransporter adhesin
VLNLNGGTTGEQPASIDLTGDGTINITAGTFQSTIGSRNAAVINQTGGTWTMTAINNFTSIGFNAGRDVNYTVSGTATLNVLAFADTNDFYTLSLGRNMGNFTSTLTLQSGGTVNVGVTANRAGQINLGSFDGNGNSLLDVQGGTLTVGTGKTTNKLYFFAAGANAGKTATMTQSGGTVTANGIQFGANTGDTAGGLVGANSYYGTALATLRLSGGNLYVGAQGITRGTAATDLPVTIQLLGGTLGAAQNWSSAMDMRLNNATIRAADSGGTARNISLSGDLSNEDGATGALTKTGPGILTLAGTNTYTGATTVSAGELKHSTAGSATTDITVAANASHGVLVASEDGQWVNTGTLTHENDSDMIIDFGLASPSTTIAPMKVDSLTLGTGIRMRISGLVSGFLPGQTLPLVTWTDSGPPDASAFSSIILPAGISGTLGVTGNTLSLTVTGNTGLLMPGTRGTAIGIRSPPTGWTARWLPPPTRTSPER